MPEIPSKVLYTLAYYSSKGVTVLSSIKCTLDANRGTKTNGVVQNELARKLTLKRSSSPLEIENKSPIFSVRITGKIERK